MPSFAQTLPVILLVGSAFATPVHVARQNDVSNKADPQNPNVALSAFKQNKVACANDVHSDKCDMEVVRRYNILELALSKRHDPMRTAPSVTAADFDHAAGEEAGDADEPAGGKMRDAADEPLAAVQSPPPAVGDKAAAVEDSPAADAMSLAEQQRTDDAPAADGALPALGDKSPSIPAPDQSALADGAAAAPHKRTDDQNSSGQEKVSAPVAAVAISHKSDSPSSPSGYKQSPSASDDKSAAIEAKEAMAMEG
ncbi:hypothetical protein CPB85DRAFT_1441308 [Mucidula mucida]|nr:hypothetical protein CPB85DRAFT_1441308 [Mucidula mucida]